MNGDELEEALSYLRQAIQVAERTPKDELHPESREEWESALALQRTVFEQIERARRGSMASRGLMNQ